MQIFLALPFMVQADLRSAINRFSASPNHEGVVEVMQLPQNAPSTAVKVKLERVNARNAKDKEGSYYVGHITVGNPKQKLSVIFHTSSGHLMIPHRACTQLACTEHVRYSPWQSATAMDVNLNGSLVSAGHRYAHGNVARQAVILDYADSELGNGVARSVIVRDHVCVESGTGESGCVDLEILAATTLPDHPFRGMPNDGIVGLGPRALSAGPLLNFFGQFIRGPHLLPQFGVSYGADDGTVTFGGHDDTLYLPPLKWWPVENPDDGYWQVKILGVRVGTTVIDACENGCIGVVDTAAGKMGVEDSKYQKFKEALQAEKTVEHEAGCQGPELIYDLGSFTMALATEDFATPKCEPLLGPVNLSEKNAKKASRNGHGGGVYMLGAPLLRRYYAAFDWDGNRVGFARSALPTGKVVVLA